MRIRVWSATALLCAFLIATPSRAEDDTMTAMIKSAGGKGAEVAAKQLAKILYDTSCKDGNQDPANKYICSILGSASGRAEEEWKADLQKKLDEITNKLTKIEKGQEEIHRELKTQHEVMNASFGQASSKVVAVANIVRIEGLWEKYVEQFDKVDNDVTRDSMVAFAKDIVKNDLHTKLADLNVVLTKNTLEGQPLLRYPFYEWTLKQPAGEMADRFNPIQIYDYSEKKFEDYRMYEQKAYAMYLWAATVLESQCRLKSDQCVALPRSTTDFKGDFDRYTRQQVETFNAAVDWLILSHGLPRVTTNGYFLPNDRAKQIYLRANILTASILSPDGGQGLWGRVFAMGDKWDGSLQVTCGGTQQTLKPVFKYAVPVGGSGGYYAGPDSGPLDWWTSSAGNSTYDEVRFSDKWQIYHYSLPSATAGPCTIARNLAGGGVMPWVQPDTKVVDVKTTDGRSFPFGSFLAIQRAGGTWALLSGSAWRGSTAPERTEDGPGQREKARYEWFIEPDHPAGPWVGLYSKARGEYRLKNTSSRIHDRNKIVLNQTKSIRFPDDPSVKFHFFPGHCKGVLCEDGGNTSILAYNIENNDTESKKGKLDALVSVSFRDPSSNDQESGAGITINGGYGKTGDRKTMNVAGEQIGVINPQPGKSYQLTYLVYFDLETEGRGLDATEYWYRALLAPGAMYFTK